MQKETLVCHAIETCSRQQKRVPISKCDKRRLQFDIGVREKVCESKCNLTTSSWSECSVTQGQGVKTRTVSCYRNGQLENVNACYRFLNLTVPVVSAACVNSDYEISKRTCLDTNSRSLFVLAIVQGIVIILLIIGAVACAKYFLKKYVKRSSLPNNTPSHE